MKLDIPFYPMSMKEFNYCGQFLLKSVFKYFLGKEFDKEYLEKISFKGKNIFTLTLGLAYAGLKEGLKVDFYTIDEGIVSDKEVPNVSDFYSGKPVKDIQAFAKGISEKAKKMGLNIDVENLSFEKLLNFVDKDHLVVVIIDYGKIYDVDKQIFHFVLLTGYDEENVLFHDVGPKDPAPNKRISKELFEKAWSAPGTDKDTVIFYK